MALTMWKNKVSFKIHHYEWKDAHCSMTSDWQIKLKEEKPQIRLAVASIDCDCSKKEVCGVDCKYLRDKGPQYYSRTECKNYIPPYFNFVISCEYAPYNWKD